MLWTMFLRFRTPKARDGMVNLVLEKIKASQKSLDIIRLFGQYYFY